MPQMLNSRVSDTRMVGSAAAHLVRMAGSFFWVNSAQAAAHSPPPHRIRRRTMRSLASLKGGKAVRMGNSPRCSTLR